MKIISYDGGHITAEQQIESLKYHFVKLKIMQSIGKSKLFRIKSKYKQRWFEKFIRNIYEKNKEEYNKEVWSDFDVIKGSYIGSIESLLLSYGSGVGDIGF